jgi:acyl transferase domain-containing protein
VSDGVLNGTHVEDATVPIAVIGMSARLPGGATDPEKLYRMCAEARDAWSTIPTNRFNQAAFYHPDANRNGTSNVKERTSLRYEAQDYEFCLVD